MFSYLLHSSELSTLLRFVSPAFFKVVPMTELVGIAGKLRANASRGPEFDSVRAELGSSLKRAGLAVRIEPEPAAGAAAQVKDAGWGSRILEAYFFQIVTSRVWILDFRMQSFSSAAAGADLAWHPRPYFWEPSPTFREGVQNLYEGFYEGKPEVFQKSLQQLGLLAAEAALRKHFGEGDQTAVRFELKTFQNTFADVFEACAAQGARIPGEFSVLGILLLSLYENLEGTGGTFNVREAFRVAKARAELVR